jgi:glycerophosphoryl diester phosphodiesterase
MRHKASASSNEALRFFAMQRAGVAGAFAPSMQALQIPEHFVGQSVPTPDFIRAARDRNLKVHIWTVNDPAEMRRLVESGVDGVMTDYPDRLLSVLGRARPEQSRER